MMPFILSRKTYRIALLGIFIFSFFIIAQNAWGAPATYQPLVGIPGLTNTSSPGLAVYLNRIYVILIAVGAIIAFLKIAMAGVKWSMSDIVTDKSSAKEDIKGALLGLAILLIPFIVLNTIYPDLTSLNILGNAGSAKVDLTQPMNTNAGGSNGSGGANQGSGSNQARSVIWYDTCKPILIPGSETGPFGPQYYPDAFDCSDGETKCNGVSGTIKMIRPDLLECTYIENTSGSSAACSVGGPCP